MQVIEPTNATGPRDFPRVANLGKDIFRILVVAVAYYAFARLGLLVAIPPGIATAVWPPSGIALAAILVWGKRQWVGIFIGSFAANFKTVVHYDSSDHSGILLIALMALGSAAQAIVGEAVIQRFVGSPLRLIRGRDIVGFLVLGAPVSCFVNSLYSSLLLCGSERVPWYSFSLTFSTWWIGDSIGVLIFTPLALTFLLRHNRVWRSRIISYSLPTSLLFALVVVIFLPTADVVAGSEFRFHMMLDAAFCFTGVIASFLLVLTGRTASVEQEVATKIRELDQQRRVLKSIIDNMGEGVVVANMSGQFTLFNQMAARLVGQGAVAGDIQDVPERYGVFLNAEKHLLPHEELPLARAIRGLSTDQLVLFMCNPQIPHGVWIECTGRPLHDEQGAICGGVVVFHDITESKLASEQLQRAKAELEVRVAERTAELVTLNEQLQRQQAELAHVMRLSTMGEIAASLAHEVNQPLYAISNYANSVLTWLENEPLPREQLTTASKAIISQTDRASAIIRNLRRFVSHTEPQKELVNVNERVHGVLSLLAFEIHAADCQVKTELATDLPQIYGDPIQIEQVLVNLILNACDAMKLVNPLHRQLIVRTQQTGDNQAEISVTDSAGGFPDAVAQKMFEPFFTTKPGGLGMGLAISRTILEAHGGRIWAESRSGEGATLYCSLPFANSV